MPNFSTRLWVGGYYPLLGVMQTTGSLVVMIPHGCEVKNDKSGNTRYRFTAVRDRLQLFGGGLFAQREYSGVV